MVIAANTLRESAGARHLRQHGGARLDGRHLRRQSKHLLCKVAAGFEVHETRIKRITSAALGLHSAPAPLDDLDADIKSCAFVHICVRWCMINGSSTSSRKLTMHTIDITRRICTFGRS